MKKILWTILGVMATLSSCHMEEPYSAEATNDSDQFFATICDDGSSKTVMDDNNNIRWSANDQLIIFKKTSLGLKYQVQDEYVGETSGYFSKVISETPSEDFGAGMSIDHNIAYYPYSSGIKFAKSGSDYTLKVTLPAEQSYALESFGNGAFPMAAVSNDYDLTFKNICGGIKLQFKGKCKVASIRIEGKNNEKLSGAATVTVYTSEESVPAIAMADNASTSVTLDCGDGVQLNEATATEFIIALPPTSFTKGFSITVTDNYGDTQTVETSKANEVLRSTLLKMPEIAINHLPKTNLSENGTANCYIVSEAGPYKFIPTKGNSNEGVGSIASVEVLWETFCTDATPDAGDLIKNVKYKNGTISFDTSDPYKEGNAVIAAKDGNGTILWSWHIWLTDQPEGQEYYNNAGIVMDRNLGATGTTPGNVAALGLLYQWGRKDPFLGSSSISSNTRAKSTITWPSAVTSTASTGTISYTVSNPTTFVTYNTNNWDWYYPDSSSTCDTRWSTSSNPKTIYDPCPAGWRTPEGGYNSVWAKALGISSYLENPDMYDPVNKGMNLSGISGSASTIWYPAIGVIDSGDGHLCYVGYKGYYNSAFPVGSFSYTLLITNGGLFEPFSCCNRADGSAVRCVQE